MKTDLFGEVSGFAGGCTCQSCAETNRHMASGFGQWPRGNPAGRKSAAAYASHVSHGKAYAGGVKAVPAFKITPEPHFSMVGLAPAFPEPIAVVRAYIDRTSSPYTGTNAYAGPRNKVLAFGQPKRGLSKLADKYRRAA